MVIVLGEGELRRLIFRIAHWERQENVLDACDDPMRVVAHIVQARVKANVLATPSKKQNAKRGKLSLRRAIAGAVDVRSEHTRNAAMTNVFVNPQKMPSGKKGLGSVYEGVSEWHHPVYGHEPIVFQAPHPYFESATDGARAGLDVAGNRALYTIARYIDSPGL